MVDKVSELSIDRIFWILGHGQLSVSPEKIIVYGLFFIGIVIFVNWLLSITVILVKPFLYAVAYGYLIKQTKGGFLRKRSKAPSKVVE